MTLYSDYTQIGNDKYYNRDLEARQALNNLGALAAKNQVALATDVSGTLPVANGGTGANNKEQARTNLEVAKSGGNLNVYVSTSGNDSTGDGSSNKPFRTIQRAINYCGVASEYIIYISAGTYSEHLEIRGKKICFIPIGSVTITHNSNRTIDLFNAMLYVDFGNSADNILRIDNTCSGGGNNTCIYVSEGSQFLVFGGVDNTIKMHSDHGFCLTVWRGSSASVQSADLEIVNSLSGVHSDGATIKLRYIKGTCSSYGLVASTGGTLGFESNYMTAGTAAMARTGGRIYTGGQTSMYNY